MVAGCATGGQAPTAGVQDQIPRMTMAAEAERNFDYSAAASHYKAILDRNPEDRDAILGLARNLRKVGLPGEASQLLSVHIAAYGQDAEFLLERAKAALAKGDTQIAIATLNQAIVMAPQDWRLFSTLGIAQDIAGQFQQAQTAYAEGLKFSPSNPEILNNMAMGLAQMGEIDQAVSTLEEAAALDQNDLQIRQNLALMYAIQGDITEAKRLNELTLAPGQVDTNLSFYSRFGTPTDVTKSGNGHRVDTR